MWLYLWCLGFQWIYKLNNCTLYSFLIFLPKKWLGFGLVRVWWAGGAKWQIHSPKNNYFKSIRGRHRRKPTGKNKMKRSGKTKQDPLSQQAETRPNRGAAWNTNWTNNKLATGGTEQAGETHRGGKTIRTGGKHTKAGSEVTWDTWGVTFS